MPLYKDGTCSQLAAKILCDDKRCAEFNRLTCWDTVFRLLQQCDRKFYPRKTGLDATEVSAVLFGAFAINHGISVKNPAPVADAVVGIYRRKEGGGGFDVSHVALCIDRGGTCISTNNGCVGGRPDYSQFNIKVQLESRPDKFPLYKDRFEKNVPPEKYSERLVIYRPVSDVLRGG